MASMAIIRHQAGLCDRQKKLLTKQDGADIIASSERIKLQEKLGLLTKILKEVDHEEKQIASSEKNQELGPELKDCINKARAFIENLIANVNLSNAQ